MCRRGEGEAVLATRSSASSHLVVVVLICSVFFVLLGSGPQFTLADWEAWFSSYSAYMLSMASLAVSENVDLFVVGTELSTTESQEYLWRKLIAEIRNITDTAPTKISLSYGANWSPGPDNVRFWDAVDYIGVDAYYPLAKTAGSTVEELVDSWGSTSKPGSILADIKNLSNAYNNKPVLFLELGYTSTAACAVGNHAGGVRNLQAQADAYTAFFKAVYQQPWFAGVFFWDWETNPNGGGRCDGGGDSFTPQGKPAEYVMRTYFNGGNASALGQSTHLRGPTPEVVFSNGKLAHRWKDYSYNGETKLESPDDPFTGNTYSAFGSYTNWGAMAFFANHGIKVTRSGAAEPNGTSFSRVCFALKPTNTSGGETQLALYGSSDESNPFSPLFVSHYTPNCTVPTGGEWIQICVPLIDLLPPLEPPGPQPPSCSDTPPPTSPQYTCAQQQSWGKCDATTNPWMKGYCCKTCFQCAPGCGKLDDDKRSSSARETVGVVDDVSYTIVKVAFKANYETGVGAFGLDEVKFE